MNGLRTIVLAAILGLLASERSLAGVGSEYISRALQGRLAGADSLFRSAAEPTAAEQALASQFRARFVERTDWADPPEVSEFAKHVVRAYRVYWTRSLLAEVDSARAEEDLLEALRVALAGREGANAAAGDDVLAEVQTALAADGLHALGGRTLPYLELMLWAREDTTRFDVELDGGTQPVEVVFVRSFLVKGWADWATIGRASTGGWATRERLFCLGDDYDLGSERFRVSYLKHEAQHFADYVKFPQLEQLDLEYRGKLTELAWSDTTTKDLLTTFAASAAANPAAPHAWANLLVVEDVSRSLFGEVVAAPKDPRWSTLDRSAARAAARALLAQHTARLATAGADTTRGVLRRERG